jgi:hypothetical protein
MRVAATSRRLDWRLPFATALIVSAPVAANIGRAPGWVDGAWKVSAVLLGFVIALVVFLFQSTAGRTLRAEQSYRALVYESLVAWPAAFALTFLAWAAVVERFSVPAHHAAAWVSTWWLALFVLQLAVLGLVFMRLIRLAAPASLARVLARALRAGVRASVEERLIRARASELLGILRERAGLTRQSPNGEIITFGRSGYIDDVDLRLLERLVALHLVGEVQHLSLELGARVDEDTAIATISEPSTQLRQSLYRDSVRLRARPRGGPDWIELFEDAVDMALRALAVGTARELDLAVDIILAGIEEVPRAYRMFGADYDSDTVVAASAWGQEDRMLAELRRLSRDVILSGNGAAAVRMPRLAHRMASTAIERRLPFLLAQALALWAYQTALAQTIPDDPTRTAVIDAIATQTFALTQTLEQQATAPTRSLDERERAAAYLADFSRFEAALLKTHLDAGDVASFEALHSQALQPFMSSDPDIALGRITRGLTPSAGAGADRGWRAARAEAQRLLARGEELQVLGQRERFKLGAWLAWSYDQGRLSAATWSSLRRHLIDPFDGEAVLAHVEEMTAADGVARELGVWEQDAHGSRRAGASVPTSQGPQIAALWTALLTLNGAQPDSPHPTSVGFPSARTAGLLNHQLGRIEHDPSKWSEFVGDDVAGRARAVREAIATSEAAGREANASRLVLAGLFGRVNQNQEV